MYVGICLDRETEGERERCICIYVNMYRLYIYIYVRPGVTKTAKPYSPYLQYQFHPNPLTRAKGPKAPNPSPASLLKTNMCVYMYIYIHMCV